jgi:uncharacterized RDD family membrane protein YckC
MKNEEQKIKNGKSAGCERYYARLRFRFIAGAIDAFVYIGVLLASLAIIVALDAITKIGNERAFIVIVPMLLWEPTWISLTGGTVGHHLMKLRVCNDRYLYNLSFWKAALRVFMKYFLGWITWLPFLSGKGVALHDSFVCSVVITEVPERGGAEFVPFWELQRIRNRE